MKIITVSGLDGSGKSTQVEKLNRSFQRKGLKTYYFHSVQFSLANQLKQSLKKLRGKEVESDNVVAGGKTTANPLAIQLRKFILPIDLLRFKRLVKSLGEQGCDIILSDRYFYDNIVNIAYLSHAKKLMNIGIQRPDFALFLDADPTKIMSRDRVPEQGLGYLVDKQKLYQLLVSTYSLVVIDANQSPQAVQDDIRKVIGGL